MKGGQYPDPTIRFYKNGKGRLPCKDVHEQAKIDGNRPILIELWLGEFRLQNSPSQYHTSSGHNSMNIGPLPSIFAFKCSL